MEKKIIQTLEELKKDMPHLKNTNVVHRQRLSSLDRLALFITQRVGTMGFFLIILSWTVLWLAFNIFGPEELHFDPFPGFVLWLFISNLIQLHLLPLIMIGQNIQGKHAELRAEHDFETDQKAEKEIETILVHLEHQQDLILEVLKRLERLEKKK